MKTFHELRRRPHRGLVFIILCALFAGFGCADADDAEPSTLTIGPHQVQRTLNISDIQVILNSAGTGEIGWKTDEYSDSALYLYPGSPPPVGPVAPTKYFPDLLIQHWISLSELQPATTYYFYVISRDESHNTVISDVRTFQTP